jgi:bifunctional non-homologous end joining protein LigD
MTRFETGKPALITRNGHDWSAKMPVLVKELASLSIESGWLDGEIVVLRDDGVPDFNALQNAFDRRTGHRDASWQIDGNIVAFAFGPVAAADQFQ